MASTALEVGSSGMAASSSRAIALPETLQQTLTEPRSSSSHNRRAASGTPRVLTQLSRRLDMMEARALSNWHEFLVHRQEVQIKFEDLFASWRGGGSTEKSKPRGAAALQLVELDRRIGECEQRLSRVSQESQEVAYRHSAELETIAGHNRAADARVEQRVRHAHDEAAVATKVQIAGGVEAAEVATELRLQRVRHEASNATEVAREAHAAITATEAWVEQRLRQSHAEAVEAIESGHSLVDQRLHWKNSQVAESVKTAETRLDQSLRRHQDDIGGLMNTIEAVMESRLRKGQDEAAFAVEAVKAAEATLEARMSRKHDEATVSMQGLEGRLAQVDQRLRKGRQESDATLESVESVIDQRLRRNCAESNSSVESVQAMVESGHQRLRNEVQSAQAMVQSGHQRLRHEVQSAQAVAESGHQRLRDEVQSSQAKAESGHQRLRDEVQSAQAMAESGHQRLRNEVAEATLAAETAVERRLTQSHNKSFEELERRLAQAHQELTGRTRAIESRLLTEFTACEEGARTAAAQVGARWCEQLAAVDDGMVRVRADAVQGVSETRSFVEQLARDRRESSNRLANLDTTVDGFKSDVGSLHREVRELSASLEQLRCSRGSADIELQVALSDVRGSAKQNDSDLTRLQGVVRDIGHRLAPVETALTGLGGDASSSREEARVLSSALRELREELSKRDASAAEMCRQIDSLRRETRETRAEASAGGERTVGAEKLAHEALQVHQETHRGHRAWRLEADEQLRCLAREAAREAMQETTAHRGEDVRYVELTGALDKLSFGAQRQEQSAARAVAELMDRVNHEGDRYSELSTTVDRLHREVRHGERIDFSAKQIQEDVARRLAEAQRLCDVRLDAAMRMAEQLRVTEGAQRNDLWREVRDIRSAIGELRLRCGLRGGGYSHTPLELMENGERDNFCRIAGI